MSKSVWTDGGFIYAVGHSEPQDDEATARDDAVADATAAFVKYCGVSVETFDRSVESYANDGEGRGRGGGGTASRVEARSRALTRHSPPASWYVTRDGSQHTAAVLVRVPKEERERIRKEKDVQLSLDALLYYEDDDGRMKPFSSGLTLRTGGRFAVYARPSDDSYVYLFEIDGRGGAFRLFPNTALATASNPLSAGKAAWMPNERSLFNLDNTTGREKLYFFASREKIPEFEGADAALTGRILDDVVSVHKIGVVKLRDKRDVVLVSPPRKTADILEVKNKLQAQGPVVYETGFLHK